MADSNGFPSPSVENTETALEGSLRDAMNAESKDATVEGTLDASFPKALNEKPNEADSDDENSTNANMEAKDMNVDESFSEAVTPSDAPAPAPTDLTSSKGLNDSRKELLRRVQALKTDLENWRGKLDTQVKSYREELGGLRSSLNSEVEQLRIEFQDLRNTLKQQRELTSTKLAKLDEPVGAGVTSQLPPLTTAVAE